MPFLKTGDGAKLYYESHGRGEPVVFLNGIMMNTVSWTDYVPRLAELFRLVVFDFRDQGKSSPMDKEYGIDRQVADVLSLLDHLEIDRAHVMGLSYGGEVALKFAVARGDRLKSLILANTVPSISAHLGAIGRIWETAAGLNNGDVFFQLSMPWVYSRHFYESFPGWLTQRQELFRKHLTRTWFECFMRLSRSQIGFRVSPEEMRTIAVPTLLIGSDEDFITPADGMEILHDNIKGSEFFVLKKAGHGAFQEKMEEFLTLIMGFILKQSSRRDPTG